MPNHLKNFKFKMVPLFKYSAGEFLDEDLWHLMDKYGPHVSFLKLGQYRHDASDNRYPFQWWVPQSAATGFKLLNS